MRDRLCFKSMMNVGVWVGVVKDCDVVFLSLSFVTQGQISLWLNDMRWDKVGIRFIGMCGASLSRVCRGANSSDAALAVGFKIDGQFDHFAVQI